MPDVYVTWRMSEVGPIYSPHFNADSGTLQITAVHVTLLDNTGAAVGGIDDTAIMTFDTDALSSPTGPQAWFLFDPTTLGLDPASLRLVFVATDTSGDKWEAVVGINLVADGGG